jgi:NADPH:quinone reductase-like Zn-dependent oxidoreductase
VNLAFPTAEIAVMGPEGAVNIVYRNAIEAAQDKDAARRSYIDEYRARFANPYEAAELGFIDEVIRPREVRRLTGGRGADVVLDMAGGAVFEQSLAALGPFGRLVVYGSASRAPSSLIAQRLMPFNQSVIGYYVSHWFSARPAQAQQAFDEVAALVLEGRLKVEVAARLPLEGAAEAHRIMESRQATGKLVLKPTLSAGS